MQPFFSKHAVAPILILTLVSIGALVFLFSRLTAAPDEVVTEPVVENSNPLHTIIGASVKGRNIDAYTYGTGTEHLLFVGGMHGGYEWNSVLLAYTFIDHLNKNPELIPQNVTVTIIPSINPDGVYAVTGKSGRFNIADVSTDKDIQASGRFNANDVDLNRNFDCKWKPTSMWRSKTVSAGAAPFSEPEARALRDFVLKQKPAAVIFWHSQSNAVYASECKNGILPETLTIMNAYSRAAGYPAVKTFDAYEITGDSEGWLASINIPAITVELKTHETIEWDKNLAGFKALLTYYGSTSTGEQQ